MRLEVRGRPIHLRSPSQQTYANAISQANHDAKGWTAMRIISNVASHGGGQDHLRMETSFGETGEAIGNNMAPAPPAPPPAPGGSVPAHWLATALVTLVHGQHIPSWIVGGCLYIFGSFGISLGLNLQKFAMPSAHRFSGEQDLEGDDDDLQARAILLDEDANVLGRTEPVMSNAGRMLWFGGFFSYLLSGVLLSLALAFSPQAELAPLLSVGVVSNVFLAYALNKEEITMLDLFGLFLTTVGTVCATLNAPHTNEDLTGDELLALFKEPTFLAFVIFLASLTLTIHFLKMNDERAVRNDPRDLSAVLRYSASSGALSGCLGGLAISMMKSMVTIVEGQYKVGGLRAVLTSNAFWLIMIPMLATWVMSVHLLTDSLEISQAKVVVTVDTIVAEVVSLLSGVLYFQEYKQMTLNSGLAFAGGAFLGILGLLVLIYGGILLESHKLFFEYREFLKRQSSKT